MISLGTVSSMMTRRYKTVPKETTCTLIESLASRENRTLEVAGSIPVSSTEAVIILGDFKVENLRGLDAQGLPKEIMGSPGTVQSHPFTFQVGYGQKGLTMKLHPLASLGDGESSPASALCEFLVVHCRVKDKGMPRIGRKNKSTGHSQISLPTDWWAHVP